VNAREFNPATCAHDDNPMCCPQCATDEATDLLLEEQMFGTDPITFEE
jgi:hypothetical protein